MANIPIGNNIIYMQKKGSTESKDTVETVLLGAERIDVGVNSGKTEIAKDKESGFNYERNAIDGKQIYNLRTQKKSCCFMVDLETGRGKDTSWYPGAIQITYIVGDDIAIRADKTTSAQIVMTLQNNTKVKILDLEYDDEMNVWYKIFYDEKEGYVRNTYVNGVRYSDPY